MVGGGAGPRPQHDGRPAHLEGGAKREHRHQRRLTEALRPVGLSPGRGAGLEHSPVSRPRAKA